MPNRTIGAEQMHKLRVLVAIVDSGSMTAAAKALGVSRSVVSGHLSTLEDSLGVKLIERTTRSMTVTHIGQQVYEASHQMLTAGRTALELVDQHLGSVRGVLRVAAPIDLTPVLLVPLIAEMRERYPQLRIEVLTNDQRIDIIRDQVDIALRVGFPTSSTLIMHLLAKTEEVLVAAPDVAQRHDIVDPQSLAAIPRVAHDVVDSEHIRLTHLGGDMKVDWPEPSVTASSSDLVRVLAIQGVGFALLPRIFVQEDLHAGRLVHLLPQWQYRAVTVYALTPSKVLSPGCAALLKTARVHLDRLLTP